MAGNDLDVMFGGGRKQVTDAMRAYLRGSGATLIEQDAAAFRAYEGKGPVWSLFAQGNMSYDLDRNDAEQPSLAEMTAKALEVLDRHKNGFFLMVEGAKIDYAGHSRCLPGSIIEMLSFDLAVAEALKFADRNGETLVVVTADHETGGLVLVDGDERTGRVMGVYVSDDHTPAMLPVFAYGPGADKFCGTYMNTEIARRIKSLIK